MLSMAPTHYRKDGATRRYTLAELEAMPTISESQTDDLKVKTDTEKVWLSRMTVEDGFPYDNQVTAERYDGDKWVTVDEYEPV